MGKLFLLCAPAFALMVPGAVFAACASPLLEWERINEGAANDVTVDSSGNYIAVGSILTPEPPGWGHLDIMIRKYGNAGALLWSRSISTLRQGNPPTGSFFDAHDRAWGVATDGTDNIFVVGDSATQWLVSKLDPDGGMLWSHTRYGHLRAYAVAVDDTGNAIVVGETRNAGKFEWTMRKFDPGGSLVWEKTETAPAGDHAWATDIAIDSGGNLVVVGHMVVFDPITNWQEGAQVRKYTSAGALLWSRTISLASYPKVSLSAGDEIVVAGSWPYASMGGWRLVKLDGAGALMWTRTYTIQPVGYTMYVGDVHVADNDDIVAVGHCRANAPYPAPYDIVVHRYDADGGYCWGDSYDHLSWDLAGGVAVDAAGAVVLAGMSGDSAWDYTDWLVLKYFPCACPGGFKVPAFPAGVTAELSELVRVVGGKEGFINPTLGENARIEVKVSSRGEVKAKLLDPEGNVIRNLADTADGPGVVVLVWDGGDAGGAIVAPGIYRIIVDASNLHEEALVVVVH